MPRIKDVVPIGVPSYPREYTRSAAVYEFTPSNIFLDLESVRTGAVTLNPGAGHWLLLMGMVRRNRKGWLDLTGLGRMWVGILSMSL